MKSLYGLVARIVAVMIVALVPAIDSFGQTVIAGEDFDGGQINITKGFDVLGNMDGGGGNWFGIGCFNAWPQAEGVPFAIQDQSGLGFPPDQEGALSEVESDGDNIFFGISDTEEIGDPGTIYTACWRFNVSSATGPMQLCIDMGQQSDGDSFNGFDAGFVLFEYRFDKTNPWITAFSCDSFDSTGSGFSYRNMDSGFDPTEAFVCQATGPAPITKISAETGLPSDNTILDKCPPTGSPGAGTLDTFVTDIGTGASVEIRVMTMIPFEGFVFDNIWIKEASTGGGVVTPTSFEVTEGDFVSGGIPDLEISDNMDLNLRRRNADLQSRTEYTLKSISPIANPATFEFTLEGSVFARGNVVQTIELFDYDLGDWELVDTSDANRAPMPDSVVTATPGGDLSRFVEAGTMCVEARILYKSDRNRQKFASNTDQAVWTIE